MHSETMNEYQKMLATDPLTQKYVSVVGAIYKKSGIEDFLRWIIDEGLMLDKRIYNRPNFLIFHYFSKRKGKRLISHRYNRLPLLPSGPGGVQQELVV